MSRTELNESVRGTRDDSPRLCRGFTIRSIVVVILQTGTTQTVDVSVFEHRQLFRNRRINENQNQAGDKLPPACSTCDDQPCIAELASRAPGGKSAQREQA